MVAKPRSVKTREPALVAYEQPLSERVRTFMRLEFLFDQANHHARGEHAWDSRATLDALLDIQSLLGKGDIRAEVLKEMERQVQVLGKLKHHAEIDSVRLGNILDSLDKLKDRLEAPGEPVGKTLKDSDFLNTLRNRASIPGGTCGFDLPGLHHWLGLPPETRIADLERWLQTLDPLSRSLRLILMLTRESSVPQRLTADAGMYQTQLNSSLPCQLIRILVAPELGVYPEISGGKHRIVVRFMERGGINQRPRQTAEDIHFQMACCQF